MCSVLVVFPEILIQSLPHRGMGCEGLSAEPQRLLLCCALVGV